MNQKTRFIVYAAVLAAMYFALTHMQNLLLPGSATWAIQCRLSEVLCIFALMTPAAIPGITIGCLLFNLSYAGALPLDFLVGSLATLLSCWSMWRLRNVTIKGYPLLAMTMPAVTNAFLVGWELTVYLGDTGFTLAAFAINAVYVAAGELIVMLIPGTIALHAIRSRHLDQTLFK